MSGGTPLKTLPKPKKPKTKATSEGPYKKPKKKPKKISGPKRKPKKKMTA